MGDAARAWARMAATAGITTGLDQVAKQIAVASLGPGEKTNVFFGIDLTNVRNTGIAFGFLSGDGTPIAIGTGVVLLLLVAYFVRNATVPWLWLPVGALLGAALGNLADRARDGAVIDFVDPIAWPAFNLADAVIVAGILGLLYVIEERLRESRGGG